MAKKKRKIDQKWKAKLDQKQRKRAGKQRGDGQRNLQKSDFARLAVVYQKQAELNPDLTLEAFADRYGIQPEWTRHFIHTPATTRVAETLSFKQATKHFGVSADTISQWIRVGALKAELLENRGFWLGLIVT